MGHHGDDSRRAQDRGAGKALGVSRGPGRSENRGGRSGFARERVPHRRGPVTAQSGPVREQWDAVYKQLTDNGFSKKPVMEGAGTSAGEAYAWAIENPDKVSCIYGENPPSVASCQRRRCSITLLRWPEPAFRSSTFAAVSTHGSMTRPASSKNDTRSWVGRLPSSSRKARDIIRWHRGIPRPLPT